MVKYFIERGKEKIVKKRPAQSLIGQSSKYVSRYRKGGQIFIKAKKGTKLMYE